MRLEQETGDVIQEMWNRRFETADMKQETGDVWQAKLNRRRYTGDVRQETWDITHETWYKRQEARDKRQAWCETSMTWRNGWKNNLVTYAAWIKQHDAATFDELTNIWRVTRSGIYAVADQLLSSRTWLNNQWLFNLHFTCCRVSTRQLISCWAAGPGWLATGWQP